MDQFLGKDQPCVNQKTIPTIDRGTYALPSVNLLLKIENWMYKGNLNIFAIYFQKYYLHDEKLQALWEFVLYVSLLVECGNWS